MAKKQTNGYPWKFCSLGGVVRVNITSGEDIAHLGELDQKLWTVLSCPTKDLEFDEQTLKLIDTDGDGRVHVQEVVAAAQWLTSVVKDKDAILKGERVLKLDGINTDCEAGQTLLASAKHILQNLGLEKDEISVEEASDSVAIFKGTKFNGDGIITPVSTDDEALKALIATIAEKVGSATDRSGEAGVTAEHVEAFYAALADYAAWQDAAEADKKNIFPYGENTAAALAACETAPSATRTSRRSPRRLRPTRWRGRRRRPSCRSTPSTRPGRRSSPPSRPSCWTSISRRRKASRKSSGWRCSRSSGPTRPGWPARRARPWRPSGPKRSTPC